MTPAQEKVAEWRRKPAKFVWDNFKVEPDKWQLNVLEAFADPTKQRISMQACAGPGKTAVLAWCAWNFLSCYGELGEHPKGAAVSITWDNLKDNLWPELSKWQGRSDFLREAFAWTKEQVFAKDHPSTWFLSARSWSKKADPEEQGRTLSGLHSKYVLALIDESGGVPLPVIKTAEQALSNCKWGKIMQAGNPTSLDGVLYAAATKQRHLWFIQRITGDPEDPERSPRVSIEWAEEQIRLYGRDNPWVMSQILGLFPPSSINTLIGPDEVEAAMNRNLSEDAYKWAQKRLGIDVARFGDDLTVIFPRQGLASFKPVPMRHLRDSAASVDIASRTMLSKQRWGSELEFFDDTVGWAHGAIDVMRNAGYSPVPVNFAGHATDPRYLNKRVEMWMEMIDWIKRGGALPNVPELVAELTTPTYTFHKGKFVLEDKDQIKKKLKRSPNYADALALTFAMPDMPATERILGMTNHGKLQHDYDPFAESRTA